jgi:hypothetical protein
VARWTDTTAYANLPAPDDADLLPIAHVSATEGSRQRTITWGQLASAAANALDDLTDVDTTGASDGDVLTYDDGDWVPQAPAGGSALATITAYAANASLDEVDDLGAYVRVTAAATITLPNGFATGWQCTIVNATDAADVDLTATGTLVLPAGFTEFVVNRRAVTVIHVGSNVWEVHGALVEEEGS